MTAQTPKPDLQFSDSVWLDVFEGAFLNDAELAGKAARLWRELLGQIESGPEGIRQARETLETAIRSAFPYTEAYKVCRDQFEQSLIEHPESD